jgi:hypothetical protein
MNFKKIKQKTLCIVYYSRHYCSAGFIISAKFPTSSDIPAWLGGKSLKDCTNLPTMVPAGPKTQLLFSAHSY